MKQRLYHFLLLVLAAAGLGGCITEVEPTADIPAIGYQRDIAPIISGNCAIPDCHTGSGEQFALLSYDDLIRHCEVKAGDAHGSKLYEVIRLYSGEEAMPPAPYTALSDEQIGLIYVWILQGAKNN